MQDTRQPMVRAEYDRFWAKYCGFFDLSVEQFMAVQEALLLQQIPLVASSRLGKRLLGKRTPASPDECP